MEVLRMAFRRFVVCMLVCVLCMSSVSGMSVSAASSTTSSTKKQIRKFVQTKPIFLQYSSRPSLSKIKGDLPKSLKVYVKGSDKKVSVPVTWTCLGNYSSTDDFYFQFDPSWDTKAFGSVAKEKIPYAGIFVNSTKGTMGAFSVTGNSNETAIYKYLTQTMGLNTAAACGVLANIKCESDFRTTLYGDHGTSYGICQWHNSRFTNLKNYCKKNGYSYKGLEGQLHFLKYELNTKAYKFILDYIKGVSNNAEGAYKAAYYWCYRFEIPANRSKVSVTRGNLAKNSFWPEYAGKKVDTKKDSETTQNTTGITVSGASKPSDMREGAMFTIKGSVKAPNKLTSVNVGVYNSQGTRKIGKTVNPNATSYNLLKVDEDIIFGKLPKGSYTYKVVAKTSSKTATLVSKKFNILGISISGASKPADMVAGSMFTVKGNVSSNAGKITSLTAAVYDNNGKKAIGKTVKPNSSTYSLLKVDEDILFGKLEAGIYTYKVNAKSSSVSKNLVTNKFKILPKKGNVKSVSAVGGKQLKVAWTKIPSVTGYQIQYSTSKNFAGAKSMIVKRASTVSATISSLEKGKKYYVRVRGYKTLSEVKHYGAYSSYKLSGNIK